MFINYRKRVYRKIESGVEKYDQLMRSLLLLGSSFFLVMTLLRPNDHYEIPVVIHLLLYLYLKIKQYKFSNRLKVVNGDRKAFLFDHIRHFTKNEISNLSLVLRKDKFIKSISCGYETYFSTPTKYHFSNKEQYLIYNNHKINSFEIVTKIEVSDRLEIIGELSVKRNLVEFYPFKRPLKNNFLRIIFQPFHNISIFDKPVFLDIPKIFIAKFSSDVDINNDKVVFISEYELCMFHLEYNNN